MKYWINRGKNNFLTSPAALVMYAGLVCFILAHFCIMFANYSKYISIWVVNAVLLVFIFRSRPTLTWPYFVVGLFANIVANYMNGAPIVFAVGFSVANSIEVLLPILFVRRQEYLQFYLKEFDRQTIALVISIPIACFIAASSAALLTVSINNPSITDIIFGWFSTDLLAMMAILPLGLSATQIRFQKIMKVQRFIELIFIILVMMIVSYVSVRYIQIRFVVILMPLLYAAFRLTLFGTSIVFFFTSAMYIALLITGSNNNLNYMSEFISVNSLLLSITLIPALIIAILIEERDEKSAQLQENEWRFRSAIRYSAIGMALVSPEGQCLIVNPALCSITGYSENELIKMKLLDMVHPDDLAEALDFKSRITQRKILSYRLEMRYIRKDGEFVWILLTESAVYNKMNKMLYFVDHIENITARKQMEDELLYQATHDLLTGLVNRREIELDTKLLIENPSHENEVSAIFFVDLDNFKYVNDSAGHAAGDELLRNIATIFVKNVEGFATVARIGGDEFAILLPGCSKERALSAAQVIIDKVKEYQFWWDGKSYQIGVSIGITIFTPKKTTLDLLLSHADTACYAAKNLGGNSVSVFEG
jgi:diguanylate cyclase (GGDEF)-like protein/PAS domain S-box-containing protein